MMKQHICPICHEELEQDADVYFCPQCHYSIHRSVFEHKEGLENKKKLRNIIYAILVRNSFGKEFPQFYYDPSYKVIESNDAILKINLVNALRSYPKTLLQRIDEILLNIVAVYDEMGCFFPISEGTEAMMFCTSDTPNNEIDYVVHMMIERGYILAEEDTLNEDVYRAQITLLGWERIEQLKLRQEEESSQAFIAMKFGDETKKTAEAIERAISTMNYSPYKMDEIEHNNQIIPEMFFNIAKSKMLIIDVSIPNLGAYYEAGYAQALGKEVIVCCASDMINEIHFDIAQKNIILWKDYEDLEQRLAKRIEATVGKARIN